MPSVPVGYTVAFADDFDGTAVDLSRWNVREDSGQNNNAAANRRSAVTVQDGYMRISATNTPQGSDPYTAGYLDTIGKWQHGPEGRWEACQRFTMGRGHWPALWFRPTGGGTDGEGDIMEAYGSPRDNLSWIVGTIHQDQSGTKRVGFVYPGAETKEKAAAIAAEWHTYGIEWDATNIVYLLDDVPVKTVPLAQFGGAMQKGMWAWRLCTQIGSEGSFAQAPDASTPWPQTYDTAWIRVLTRN
jgi:beta-glucanase (GH16 family)